MHTFCLLVPSVLQTALADEFVILSIGLPLLVPILLQTYWRPLRYEWSDPSLIGSLMMISPLRILMLYRQEGLVQTQALYSIEAPWLPKSESGTRSPSLHLRHRGNAFSTKSPPSFSMEESFRQLHQFTEPNKKKAEGEPPPLHPHPHSMSLSMLLLSYHKLRLVSVS